MAHEIETSIAIYILRRITKCETLFIACPTKSQRLRIQISCAKAGRGENRHWDCSAALWVNARRPVVSWLYLYLNRNGRSRNCNLHIVRRGENRGYECARNSTSRPCDINHKQRIGSKWVRSWKRSARRI